MNALASLSSAGGRNEASTALRIAVVVSLLAAHAVFSFSAMLGASATFDENLHIAAGLSYWKFDDYRLQPENGNLPQRWCALPLVAMGCTFPDDEARWRISDGYGLGQKLLYGGANDPRTVLAAARAMSVVWSTALCLVVFLWSRSLFGFGGGLLSLGLAAFWPALVAHGPLATSDACGALFFTLATWALWNLLQEVSPATLALACGSVGLAAIAKHSSVLLAPLALVLLATRLADGRPLRIRLASINRELATPAAKLGLGLALLTATMLAAALCIWISCGCRYKAANPAMGPATFYLFPSLDHCALAAGGVGRLCHGLGTRRLLPEPWLFGLTAVVACSTYRYAFALGQHSLTGWWWFFPLCLAIKNTLPALALSAWGVLAWCRAALSAFVRRLPLDPAAYGSIPLVATLAVLWPTFLTSHLNIGERHLLPSYPPLMIMAGAVWRSTAPGWRRWLVVALVSLHAFDVASRWPATLAYFNQIVPRGQEYRWLVDSSLDWGQDVDRLAVWLTQHRQAREPVYVTIFGGPPAQMAIPGGELLGFAPRAGEPQELRPGLYCVSATTLQGINDVPRGPWCRTHERLWQTAANFMRVHGGRPDETAAEALVKELADGRDEAKVKAIQGVATAVDRAVAAFSVLQAGRLKAFLRHRTPDAVVGRSILCFRLSADDITAALTGPSAELAEQSWFEREGYATSEQLLKLGRQRLAAHDAAGAREIFSRMLVFYPSDPRAWVGLSVASEAAGLPAEAARARREAERLIEAFEKAGEP